MSRQEWLNSRKRGIGGSDAAAVFGQNPYMTNVELWEIKTGRREQADISDKECVKFGVAAEGFIRELFALDNPEYKIVNEPFKIYENPQYPFIIGTFDGIIEDDKTRQTGLLEIKTGTIRRSSDWNKWGDNIMPQNYYIQILHYFLVREDFEFAVLKARLTEKKYNGGRDVIHIKQYDIKRSDCLADMEMLLKAEGEFWDCVESDIPPPLIIQGL